MAKIKYFYNPHSLDFEKVTTSVRGLVLRVFGFLSASVVAGSFLLLLAYNYIDSPKEKVLRREMEDYQLQTQRLNQRMDRMSKQLRELQEKDISIYRAIFETDPPNFKKVAPTSDRPAVLNAYSHSEAISQLNDKVEVLNRELQNQNRSFDQLRILAARKNEFLASIPAIQPITNRQLKHMASGFGYRLHPIYKTYKMHTGIDFTAPTGTPIYATGNGRVALVELGHRGYGNHVVVHHGFGYQSLYGHMSRVKVRPGQLIRRGELIGYVGNSGLSSAPHLHYEIIRGGKKINPINYFFNDLTEADYVAMREMAERPAQSFD